MKKVLMTLATLMLATHVNAGNSSGGGFDFNNAVNAVESIFGRDSGDKNTNVAAGGAEDVDATNIQDCLSYSNGICLAYSGVATNQNVSSGNSKQMNIALGGAKTVKTNNEQTAKVLGGGVAQAAAAVAGNQNVAR